MVEVSSIPVDGFPTKCTHCFRRDIVAAIGPVSICMRVESSFYNYRSGVYFEPTCGQVINHAMLLVGYGTDPVGGDYWIVKNSWGEFGISSLGELRSSK